MKKILTIILSLSAFTYMGAQISINAVIPSNIPAGTSVDAEVKINKGNIGNFAKYQMDVPAGYSVTGVDVQGGNFTFENQRAKIVWVSVPSTPEFSVRFTIKGESTATNQGPIVQKFFYLENNEKKEVEGNTVSLGGSGSSDVASTPVTSSTPVTTTQVETVQSTPVDNSASTPVEPVKTVQVETVHTEEPVKTTPVATTTAPKTTAPVTSTSSAGMTYKVQLGAYSTQPSKSKFAAAGNVTIDQVDGLYKVTAGSFKTKEEAMKHRDELQGKGFTGFIVTYQNGVRVK